MKAVEQMKLLRGRCSSWTPLVIITEKASTLSDNDRRSYAAEMAMALMRSLGDLGDSDSDDD